ncbi:hypothetical protein DERP_003274, partial [Dermatophagoides pteronyssinus]
IFTNKISISHLLLKLILKISNSCLAFFSIRIRFTNGDKFLIPILARIIRLGLPKILMFSLLLGSIIFDEYCFDRKIRVSP